ncbi:MAG: exopolyphosphatase [Acetatifactor sp.]|nr:exopolyphosphatase [Acetatifactor sp.]
MSTKTFAAIDIGSFELSMKIFEFNGKNKIREIDFLSKKLDLGSDSYARGKIDFEKVEELCKTLREFKNTMESYGVEEYKAYGTSAVRESKNMDILLDRIEKSTGIKIEVLSNSEQRFLDYKSVAAKGEEFRKILEGSTAIVDIGGGSIQISLFENDTLISTQNIRIGVLRVNEILNQASVTTSRYREMCGEIAMPSLDSYKKLYVKDREIKNIIIIDDYLAPVAVRKAKEKGVDPVMSMKEYIRFLSDAENKTGTDTAKAFGIESAIVPLFIISSELVRWVATILGAEKIWTPGVRLGDGMAYEYAEKIKMFRGEHDFEKDILASAYNIASRYECGRKKCELLEKISTGLFDALKNVHGLSKRDKLYLRIAAILADVGKYVSLENFGDTGYNIVMASEIIGLSHREREIVANIVRYNVSEYDYDHEGCLGNLDGSSYIIVAKLASILRVATGLTGGYFGRVKDFKPVLDGNRFVINVTGDADLTMEKAFFESKAGFFTEVYNITPVLNIRKN